MERYIEKRGQESRTKTCKNGLNYIKNIKYKSVKKKCLTNKMLSCKIAEVITVDTILKQSLLYDFYGELLTNHQKEVYEQFVLEDLSLSEIAQSAGISRQGVHDMVKRCQKTLEGYEEKLHLVEKFIVIQERVRQIDEVLDEYEEQTVSPENMAVRIREISDRIIEEL